MKNSKTVQAWQPTAQVAANSRYGYLDEDLTIKSSNLTTSRQFSQGENSHKTIKMLRESQRNAEKQIQKAQVKTARNSRLKLSQQLLGTDRQPPANAIQSKLKNIATASGNTSASQITECSNAFVLGTESIILNSKDHHTNKSSVISKEPSGPAGTSQVFQIKRSLLSETHGRMVNQTTLQQNQANYANHSSDIVLSDDNSILTAGDECGGQQGKSQGVLGGITRSVLGSGNGSLGCEQYFKKKAQRPKLQMLQIDRFSASSNLDKSEVLTACSINKPTRRLMQEYVKASGPLATTKHHSKLIGKLPADFGRERQVNHSLISNNPFNSSFVSQEQKISQHLMQDNRARKGGFSRYQRGTIAITQQNPKAKMKADSIDQMISSCEENSPKSYKKTRAAIFKQTSSEQDFKLMNYSDRGGIVPSNMLKSSALSSRLPTEQPSIDVEPEIKKLPVSPHHAVMQDMVRAEEMDPVIASRVYNLRYQDPQSSRDSFTMVNLINTTRSQSESLEMHQQQHMSIPMSGTESNVIDSQSSDRARNILPSVQETLWTAAKATLDLERNIGPIMIQDEHQRPTQLFIKKTNPTVQPQLEIRESQESAKFAPSLPETNFKFQSPKMIPNTCPSSLHELSNLNSPQSSSNHILSANNSNSKSGTKMAKSNQKTCQPQYTENNVTVLHQMKELV